MVKIQVEPDCGNAPRRELLKELVVALAERNAERVMSFVADDIAWTLVGERTLTGADSVRRWMAQLSIVDEVAFGSLLTHGRGASVDGELRLTEGARTGFCHVVQFASMTKTAKIRSINSYFITVPTAG